MVIVIGRHYLNSVAELLNFLLQNTVYVHLFWGKKIFLLILI